MRIRSSPTGRATTVHTRVDVETEGTETASATCVDLHNMLRREPNAHVAMELDVARFWSLVEDSVRALAQGGPGRPVAFSAGEGAVRGRTVARASSPLGHPRSRVE